MKVPKSLPEKWFPTLLEILISCEKKMISIWKWVFVNDLLAKKMISGLFWLKIKWLPPVRNDLRKVWKWFSTQENDFERTQNDYRGNDFFEMLLQEFKAWFTLEKKTFSTEIIISGNGWKSFFSRKCSTTSQKYLHFSKNSLTYTIWARVWLRALWTPEYIPLEKSIYIQCLA